MERGEEGKGVEGRRRRRVEKSGTRRRAERGEEEKSVERRRRSVVKSGTRRVEKSGARRRVENREGGEGWRRTEEERKWWRKGREEEEERCNEGLCNYDGSWEKMNAVEVPRQYPLVLVVKVKVKRSERFGFAAEEVEGFG